MSTGETHEILLVSTPRDYYVPLALSGNPYDKLTHAGIYGMDVLLGTLEALYETEIDYYFRINFTGFTEIIDALGGIDVSSEYEFTAGGHDYHVGTNHLDGEEALSFARERYSFTEGDRQRGKNQMAVIEGVLEKALSPSILTGYLDILESVEDCVDTSIPYDLIAELVPAAGIRERFVEHRELQRGWERLQRFHLFHGTGIVCDAAR